MKKQFSLALICTSFLFAQQDTANSQGGGAYKLEKSVISATLSDFTLEQQSKSISVLDEKTLLETGGGTGGVQSTLEQAPGILYSRFGGLGGTIYVRGLNSSSDTTMITIDETRVLGRAVLEYNVFDLNSIDSIEIIRGPASALFGSNAMNGVINFKSRRFKGDINQAFNLGLKLRNLEYSSVNNGFGGRLEVIGGGNGFDILMGLNGKMGQDYRTPDGVIEHSKYNLAGFDWNIGYTTKNDIRYYTQGRLARVMNENAGGRRVPAVMAWTKEDPLTELYLKGGLEAYNIGFAEKMDAFVYWRRYDTDLYNYTKAGSVAHKEVKNSDYVGGRLAFRTQLDKHNLGYGLDTTQTITSTRNKTNGVVEPDSAPTAQSEIGLFLKDDFTATENLLLSASVRGDYVYAVMGGEQRNSSDTNAITGSLGAVYFFTPNFSSALNLSRNFLAPWVGYKLSSQTPVITQTSTLPNPNLSPEYSHTAELSFRYSNEKNEFQVTGYRTEYTDKITAVRLADGNSQYQNIGQSYIQGIEWQGQFNFLNDFTFAFLGTALYGHNKTDDKPLPYIAPLYGRISLQYDMPWGYIKVQERAYQGKSRIDESEEKKTKSYAMTDIFVNFDLGYLANSMKAMSLNFGIENVFDKKATKPTTISIPTLITSRTNPLLEPGINLFVKYSYNY